MVAFTNWDRQKSKLVVFFSALGLGGFVLNLLAGIGVWSHIRDKSVPVPTYDSFINQVRYSPKEEHADIARGFFENWSQCVATAEGMNSVVVHALVTGSIAGIIFFAICLGFSWQLYKKVNSSVVDAHP